MARDTKLGPEEITRDIPNVGEDALEQSWTRPALSILARRLIRAIFWSVKSRRKAKAR